MRKSLTHLVKYTYNVFENNAIKNLSNLNKFNLNSAESSRNCLISSQSRTRWMPNDVKIASKMRNCYCITSTWEASYRVFIFAGEINLCSCTVTFTLHHATIYPIWNSVQYLGRFIFNKLPQFHFRFTQFSDTTYIETATLIKM